MPRPQRINSTGAFFHVMARGNNRQPIFQETADYVLFEGLLRQATEKFDFLLHAYCLMRNHIHLLIETGKAGISVPMDWLLGVYAQKFNQRVNRIGHLFQGRFLSKLIVDERYLLSVSRYIHRNPVKAALSCSAEDYPWSSMPVYLGKRQALWVCTKKVLAFFSESGGLERLRRFTALPGGDASEESSWPTAEAWYQRQPPWTDSSIIRQILEHTAGIYRLDVKTLLSRKRTWGIGPARAALMLALRRKAGLSVKEIACLLGCRSTQVVYNALSKSSAQPPKK